MKGEPLEKPPPLLLPPTKHRPDHRKRFSFKEKEKASEERSPYKFTPRYDMFHGILKRVSDMKMNGSLDSEEPSTESEKSEYSTSRLSKARLRSGSSSTEDRSNISAFEDESSASSVAGSDHCLPYEEIPGVGLNRYSCIGLPSPPALSRDTTSSFRDNFPPPPSPTDLGADDSRRTIVRQSSSAEYKKEGVGRKSAEQRSRPTSFCSAGDAERRQFFSSDVNDNRTEFYERRPSVEESRHPEGLADSEKHQLEMFFKSLKTEVFVCGSLANLYVGWKEQEGNWTYRHTGVVVVILDCGDTRSRRKRRIQILLAERGTCFPLWKDTIDNLSAYEKSGSAFHTMHLSSDHRQIVGFSFDSPPEAENLIRHIEYLTSNPENINISVPGSKKKIAHKKKPAPLPHKKHISNPCLFQHVTSVAARDKTVYMSLQTLIDHEMVKKRENIS